MTTTFETTDLYLACALKTALRLPFPEIQPSGRFSTFRFHVDPTEAQRVSEQFYNGALPLDAREFSTTLRDLKALLLQKRGATTR
jgi:hypothetical protein